MFFNGICYLNRILELVSYLYSLRLIMLDFLQIILITMNIRNMNRPKKKIQLDAPVVIYRVGHHIYTSRNLVGCNIYLN